MSDPQRQFFSTQDIVAPDIDLYYNKVIKDIDSFRSRFNGNTANLGQTISLKNLDGVFANNDMTATSPQESRCSAFFRMIGFPVVSADGTALYSPGFDPDLNRDADRIQKNLDIANSTINKLKTIFDERETYAKNSSSTFKNTDNNAIALAISSIYVRPFDKQLKEGLDPLEIDTQTFNVPDRTNVSSDFTETVSYSTQSKHILKPFIVDPRIELTITPGNNKICAPFLTDKSKTQLSRSTYLKRPYLERVMRVRFNNINVLAPANQESANQFIKDLITFIQTNSEITHPSLVEITANSLQSLHKSELMVFGKLIRIIEALVLELVQAFIEIENIRKNINWKPMPNVNGPEFGATLNAVDITDTTNNKQIETDISKIEMQKLLEETDFDLGINTPDLGNFSFSNVDDIVFGSLKNISQFYDKQLDTLNKKRNNVGNRAIDLLRRIEIITGEFSGLGLLDIVAIQAALWVVKPGALLGMIDDKALERMQTFAELKVDTGSRLGAQDALQEFEKKLSEIYVLIGAFYKDIFVFGGRNKQ